MRWKPQPRCQSIPQAGRQVGSKPVTIHDSWTGKANESLFKPFYTAAREARTQLIQAGGEPYKNYKTRLSIALRLLWPKRPSQRSPFWWPDWRMVEAAAVCDRRSGRVSPASPHLHAYGSTGASVAWAPGLALPTTVWPRGSPAGPLSVTPRHRGRHSSR
ncbi:hypothetical protein ACFXDI_53355 [Streptomyces mirabilis]|uniref:hypothetical protein n=1 Tax=Streptomyces mirabilis TaxID=68239 RepID=UPI00367D8AD2